ncbi:hypothetical protein [Mycoplasmopsis californica]|nr:hypothetical protein [Mycoplasmopsis californica]
MARNQLTAKPIRMNESSDKNYQIVPVLNPLAEIGFPGRGFKTGYVIFRPKRNGEKFTIRQYPNYSPLQFGRGNSGSLLFIWDGDYSVTWQAELMAYLAMVVFITLSTIIFTA